MKNPGTLLAMVRQTLGCRQEEMAAYLDVSRALISNAEISNRFLPAKAEMKLLALYQLIQQTPAPKAPTKEKPVSSHKHDDHIFKMKARLAQQRKKCQALAENRELALAAQGHAAWIRQNTPPEDKGLHLFLNLLEAEAKEKLGRHTPEKLSLENLKLKGIEAACKAVAGIEHQTVQEVEKLTS